MGALDSIAVTTWGASGERIVLVHGGVQGSHTRGAAHFARQEALAAKGFQLVVPDRPGHGQSPSPGRPDDSQADGAWVAELLGDRAHVVGHSFGAVVALAAAARRPGAVKSLTLIEPGMLPVALPRRPVVAFVLRTVLILKLNRAPAKRIRAFAQFMHIPPDLGGASATEEEAVAMGKALDAFQVPKRGVLERELSIIRDGQVPLLVVSGGWSRAMDVTADVVATLGRGERVTLPSPHHFPQLASDEFNALLVRFIAEANARR
jgi:pimeloyl-ACP methyl ester carboxylesterase